MQLDLPALIRDDIPINDIGARHISRGVEIVRFHPRFSASRIDCRTGCNINGGIFGQVNSGLLIGRRRGSKQSIRRCSRCRNIHISQRNGTRCASIDRMGVLTHRFKRTISVQENFRLPLHRRRVGFRILSCINGIARNSRACGGGFNGCWPIKGNGCHRIRIVYRGVSTNAHSRRFNIGFIIHRHPRIVCRQFSSQVDTIGTVGTGYRIVIFNDDITAAVFGMDTIR